MQPNTADCRAPPVVDLPAICIHHPIWIPIVVAVCRLANDDGIISHTWEGKCERKNGLCCSGLARMFNEIGESMIAGWQMGVWMGPLY